MKNEIVDLATLYANASMFKEICGNYEDFVLPNMESEIERISITFNNETPNEVYKSLDIIRNFFESERKKLQEISVQTRDKLKKIEV